MMEIFLVGQLEPTLAREAMFGPGSHGPVSRPVKLVLRRIQRLGWVVSDGRGRQLRLTDRGVAPAKQAENSLGGALRRAIADIKGTLNGMSADDLLVFIAYSYPAMIDNPASLRRAASIRIPRAVALKQRGIVSLEKGAELAGLPFLDFKDKIGRRSTR